MIKGACLMCGETTSKDDPLDRYYHTSSDIPRQKKRSALRDGIAIMAESLGSSHF